MNSHHMGKYWSGREATIEFRADSHGVPGEKTVTWLLLASYTQLCAAY